MPTYTLPELAALIVARDRLPESAAEETANRLRRLRDQRALRTIEGTGGRGRGKAASLNEVEAAKALILEMLASLDMAREATDKAILALEAKPNLPHFMVELEPGVLTTLTALEAALHGIRNSERWILQFKLMTGAEGRKLSAQVERDQPEDQKSKQKTDQIVEAGLSVKGVRVLGSTELNLAEILDPILGE